jgi:hypothetical protein
MASRQGVEQQEPLLSAGAYDVPPTASYSTPYK